MGVTLLSMISHAFVLKSDHLPLYWPLMKIVQSDHFKFFLRDTHIALLLNHRYTRFLMCGRTNSFSHAASQRLPCLLPDHFFHFLYLQTVPCSERLWMYIPILAEHTYYEASRTHMQYIYTTTSLNTQLCVWWEPLECRRRIDTCSVYLWSCMHGVFSPSHTLWDNLQSYIHICCLSKIKHSFPMQLYLSRSHMNFLQPQ